MTPSLSVLAAASTPPSCVTDSTTLCAKVYGLFGLNWLAANAQVLIATPARILVIVVAATVARLLVHRGIARLTARTATGDMPPVLRPLRNRVPSPSGDGEVLLARRSQRAEAIGSVLRSFASFVLLGIAVVLVLGQLGIDLAPIVASSAVLGVALGFGAQNLVKDFIAGIGIILEDQYGVGDVVDLGTVCGTVEAVGLRITRLRDGQGVVWYARNGEILRVGNKSQGVAQVVVDIPVAHDTDLEACRAVMQEVGDALYAEEEWSGVLAAAPESLGVEQITTESIVMRLQVPTSTTEHRRVARELQLRLKERFVLEGIRTPQPLLAAATPAAR